MGELPLSVENAIIKVGGGRGFLVEGSRARRFVITAAHCLSFLPPAHAFADPEERTYTKLIGPVGAEPTMSAECLFVDPIADLAVLGESDNQSLADKSEAYNGFVERRPTLRIGVVTSAASHFHARLLTLDGRWEQCTVRVTDPYSTARSLTLVGVKDGNKPGTSGSPILSARGRALGVVVVSSDFADVAGGERRVKAEEPGQPLLSSNLPLWLLSDLGADTAKARALCRQHIGAVRRRLQSAVPDAFS